MLFNFPEKPITFITFIPTQNIFEVSQKISINFGENFKFLYQILQICPKNSEKSFKISLNSHLNLCKILSTFKIHQNYLMFRRIFFPNSSKLS